MSILLLQNVSLNLAGNQILNQVSWGIQPNARIALVGRNGAGKSTLLKILQGDLQPDSGEVKRQSGLVVSGLQQSVPLDHQKDSVYSFLVAGLGDVGQAMKGLHEASISGDLKAIAAHQESIERLDAWDKLPQVDIVATKLGIDKERPMHELSGGMKRRVLLGCALIAKPDLLLLDEPTNHLDVGAIEWLESYLKSYPGSVVIVTHDRQFLSQTTRLIVELDRGQLRSFDCDYETYLERREAIRLTEAREQALFDKKLAEEEVWLRQGVKARRTRNEGRVRALESMREAYQQRRNEKGRVQSLQLSVAHAQKQMIEVNDLHYALFEKPLIQDFSLLLQKGDKIGIIGPNGCGKTTLIRLLLGELTPQSGTIRRATGLKVAYFDQLRNQLDDSLNLMQNVGEGSDFVTIDGKQKHVASYLRDFLFSPAVFNQPISSFSGGERNRLLLAKLFAKSSNLLVMDEPSNDLDIETLELLEGLLLEYTGTLLLITHDRALINHVVTSVLVYEDGQFNEYVGGYDDYLRQRTTRVKQEKLTPVTPASQTAPKRDKLSFNEQRELAGLPLAIEVLERDLERIQADMATTDFYQQNMLEIAQVKKNLAEKEDTLKTLFDRWEALEARR